MVTDRANRLAGLLEEARAGRQESLNAIVAELTPVLWQVVRAQGLDRDLAEDVVQTTWLRLLDHLGRITTPRALAGWLVTVAKREAWDVRAATATAQPWDEQTALAIPDGADPPDEQVIADERRRLLWTAIKGLDERCRSLLRAMAFAMPFTDVATALGMPVGSIGPTRGRCLAKLRSSLAAEPSWSRR
jgi:RNA polymerase sigma factor (sigma-70 family)